jgi:hypothetical protein
VLRLDQGTRTATRVGEYTHGTKFDTQYMGSMEPLPGGNEFVGWGSAPYFSEYSASGQLLLDAKLPGPDLSYRARLEPWIGQPLDPPSGAARQARGATTVYASWNGATEVAGWRVLAGSSTGPMAVVATRPKSGFETAIRVPRNYQTFRVEALGAGGRMIGASRTFAPAVGGA